MKHEAPNDQRKSQISHKRVLAYIDRHKDENLDLEVLARVARISKFHFHRLFRGYMGVSLGQYIKLARLESSMHGLTFGTHSILDIALSAGYETHASFVKAFRQKLGCTPSEFRKRFEEEKGKFMSMLKHKKPDFLGVRELTPIKISYVRETGSYFESSSNLSSDLRSIFRSGRSYGGVKLLKLSGTPLFKKELSPAWVAFGKNYIR